MQASLNPAVLACLKLVSINLSFKSPISSADSAYSDYDLLDDEKSYFYYFGMLIENFLDWNLRRAGNDFILINFWLMDYKITLFYDF